jgi:hypothetical protein
VSAGILKTRITWGPLGPPTPPTLPVAAVARSSPSPSPPPAPLEPPTASYGVASGVLTLAGRPYAWSFRVRNPYLSIEQGVDQEALRKWRIAVLRDLIRHKVEDVNAVRTARVWADLSWVKIARLVHPAVRQQRNPKTPRGRRTALAMAYLALQIPGGTPSAFGGGPRAQVTHPERRREKRVERYQPLVPSAVTDQATGAAAHTPRRLRIEVYQATFPDDRVPPIPEKRRRADLVVVHANYAGLWKESARRVACGKQGGRGKKKLRPAPAAAEAERSETPPGDLSRA